MGTVSTIQSGSSETGAMLSQNEISLLLACTNYWTNTQVNIDYKRNDARVVSLWVPNN